jgi:hypothetical protein
VAARIGTHGALPEIDRGGWFDRAEALHKIVGGQRPILEEYYAEFGSIPSTDGLNGGERTSEKRVIEVNTVDWPCIRRAP